MKTFLKSKTLWFNLIAAILTVVTDNMRENVLLLDDAQIVVYVAAFNAILRLFTTKPIAEIHATEND